MRRALAGWAVALLLAVPAPAAAEGPGPVFPLRVAFADHKQDLLNLEARLRAAPDSALTGLPGFPVLLLACDAAGCVGPHQVRIDGAADIGGQGDPVPGTELDDAFAAGGWLPVALTAQPGTAVGVSWTADGRELHTQVPVPQPGRVTVLTRDGRELVVRGDVTPAAGHAWRVALAEQARGDGLAAIAVLEAGRRLFGPMAPRQALLLADLYRHAALTRQAEVPYRELLNAREGDIPIRARMGLARTALDWGLPEDAVKLLSNLRLQRDHPLQGEVNGLLIRAQLALDPGPGLIQRLPESGGDPFVAVNRAMAFMAVGDTFTAVSEFNEAARNANRSLPVEAHLRERALLAVGTLYAEQGRLEDALQVLDEMSPDGVLGDRYRYGRGMAFYLAGERVKAVVEFQALERDWPDSPYRFEALLMAAEAYRQLGTPSRAVAEYRKALRWLQNESRRLDGLMEGTRTESFDTGLTGAAFSGRWRELPRGVNGNLSTGLRVLFRTPGISLVLDDYRQIGRTIGRLEWLNRRLTGGNGVAAEVSRGIDQLEVFRNLFENAVRQVVIQVLAEERERIEELSVAAGVGVTQSLLFDRPGAAAGTGYGP